MYLVIEPVIAVVEPVETTVEQTYNLFYGGFDKSFCKVVSMDVVVKVASTGSATVCGH